MREGVLGLAQGIRQGSDSRRRFRAGRAVRQLIAAGNGADDIRLDDDVGRAADHEEMLDIVAPDQHEAAAAIHGGGVDDGKTRHPSTLGVGAEAVARESAHQPEGNTDQGEDRHERK
jgi:hypothetical protein